MSELISAIIPVYNGSGFLGAAIESAKQQVGVDMEIIVIDDGSTDGSAELAEAAGVHVIRQPNGGVAAARNTGINAARGSFIALLDADDVWQPQKSALQMAALASQPECAICFTAYHYVLEPGTTAPVWFDEEKLGSTQTGPFPSTWMFPRELFERVGGFDPSYRVSEDVDWLARAYDSGARSVALPDDLLVKRIHTTNLSGAAAPHQSLIISALRASVARKRAAAEGRE